MFVSIAKKNEKSRKNECKFVLGREDRRSCGGRREGKEGKPFRDRRLNASVQNHASTLLGYGELRTLRETAALREGMLRMGYAIHCRFCAQGVPKMCSEKPFCSWGRRSIASFLARQVPRKRPEKHAKSFPNLAQNHRKTCPEAPSKTEKHQ